VPGPVDVARAQVADQQLLATEHIERQKTVIAIVPVEVGSHLRAVHPIIGGVKIQDELLGRRFEAGHKLFKEHLVHLPGFLAPGPVFPPAEG